MYNRLQKMITTVLDYLFIHYNISDYYVYRAHCRTRVTIEQLNGQLKNKFRCLMGQGIPMSAPRACDIIIACAVLFNIAKDLKEPEQIIEVEPDEVPHHPADQNQLTGIALRAELINNYFS